MAMPPVVKALSQEFYGLHDAGAIPTQCSLTGPEWRRLCAWLDQSPTVSCVALDWPIGRRGKARQSVLYMQVGPFGVD